MAITIQNKKFIRFTDKNGNSEVIAEIYVDSADELPKVNGINGTVLHQGSVAFVIKENKLAVLAGDGNWYFNN